MMDTDAPVTKTSDEELVAATLAGDRDAWLGLDRRWRERLAQLAWSILRDRDAGREVAQIALWNAFKNLRSFDRSRSFQYWILTIAGNAARDCQRRSDVLRNAGGDAFLRDTPEGNMSTEEAAKRRDEIAALRACIEELQEQSRTVIGLYQAECTLKDMSATLDEPRSTVQGWLRKAMEQLKRCLVSKGIGLDS